MEYNLAYISYNNNDQGLKERSVELLEGFFGSRNFSFNEVEGHVLFVASGGSEQHAVRLTKNSKDVIVLCHRENNSFAAAMEIAAFLRSQNKRVSLVDVLAAKALDEFNAMLKVNNALRDLAGEKVALIGDVSDWLIVSDVEDQIIKEKLGVELLRIPWDSLEDYKAQKASVPFMDHFPNVDRSLLNETAKVYSMLEKVVSEENLSAISVECFSMVVSNNVTACLPLAVLNQKKIVAACEGDICSMLGMMMILAVTDEVPWQANVAEIKNEMVLLAHCTAPLGALKSFEIATHFETNCGTAIRGKFGNQKVGVFRVDNNLQDYMLLQGDIVNTPDYNFACRTQVELKMEAEQVQLLKSKSLGNHHLVFPARHIPVVERLMDALVIEKVG